MRKIYYLFVVLSSLLILQGCDKFLDLKPENIKVVSTVEDYRDLLASYMRLLKNPGGSQQKVLGGYHVYPVFDVSDVFIFRTGEVELNKQNKNYFDATLGEYTQEAIDILTWMEAEDNLWNGYYTFLGPINMIIDGVTTAIGDDERLRDYVKGEALVWRAFSFFKLLQYYAPYNRGDYGIPIYLKPYEDPANAMPERKTQSEVYRQIFQDCKEVLELLERTPSTTWNFAYEPRFVHGMLASIYCYKALSAAAEESDWENAILHADKVLSGRVFTRNQQEYTDIFDIQAARIFTSDEFYCRLVDASRNPQVCSFSRTYYQDRSASAYGTPDVAPDFYALYRDDDVRKQTFFRVGKDNSITFNKYNMSGLPAMFTDEGGICLLFRTAEIQLIKAEALCRLGKEDEARKVLNGFKQGRYIDIENSYTESDLLNEILKERKLEFFHEQDMWWLDMKRTSFRMERVINGTLYVLEPDDFRYTFPIPQSEMEVNKNMVQNPGWNEINF